MKAIDDEDTLDVQLYNNFLQTNSENAGSNSNDLGRESVLSFRSTVETFDDPDLINIDEIGQLTEKAKMLGNQELAYLVGDQIEFDNRLNSMWSARVNKTSLI